MPPVSNKPFPIYPIPKTTPVVLYDSAGQPITVVDGAISVNLASAADGARFTETHSAALLATLKEIEEILFRVATALERNDIVTGIFPSS